MNSPTEYNLHKRVAKFYDYDKRDNLIDDIPFYSEYSDKYGKNVLELGCGTGRVTLALAAKGCTLTGLDLSDSMLEIFQHKLDSDYRHLKEKISCVNESMSRFDLGRKFDMVIAPFRSFQVLTTPEAIDGCFSSVKKHMNSGGIFIINAFRPNRVMDESWCFEETVQWEAEYDKGVTLTKKHWGEHIDIQKQIIYPSFAYELSDKDGLISRHVEKLSLKYYYYQDLKDLITSHGFSILEEFGWYDKSSIENGRELIFVCKIS